MIKGADISHYQTGISYDRLAELARFVIVKATQDDWTDSEFTDHLRAVKARRMVPGAYHFLVRAVPVSGQTFRPSASPTAQARAFVAAARSANGGALDGLLVALDWEPFDRRDGNGRVIYSSRPRWSDIREWVDAFRKLAPTHPLFIYSRSNVIGDADLSKLPGPVFVWLAYWNRIPGAAPKRVRGRPVLIHQYGYLRPMKIDGNVFRGSLDDLRRYTRPFRVAPVPDPDPEPTPDPDPSPAPAIRYCLRLQGLPLRALPRLEARPLAVALYGAPLLVAPGPSTAGTAPAGSPSDRWLEVRALSGTRLDPPLWTLDGPQTLGDRSPLP